MSQFKRILIFRFFAGAACVLFLLTGAIFLGHLGLQNDESIFVDAIYKPYAVVYFFRIRHSTLPLMLLSYLGTLKAWLYRPIFHWLGTGVFSLRIPTLFAGGVSVWLFYLFLRRIAGERTASIGCGLLATDSIYLLSSCFDWGPVALQHLLLTAAMVLLVRFYQERNQAALGWGCFLLGLAIWDKALAIWMLSGMGAAVPTVFGRRIVAVITPRRVAIALLSFALGALPLILYNIHTKMGTFRGNASWDTSELPTKVRLLETTANGSAMFGWLVQEDWQTDRPNLPHGALQSASAKISALAAHPRHNLLLYAFMLALLLAPLARGNALRAILFGIIAMAIAWAQMAITAHAGASVHHAILLWPLPEMVIAVSFAAASRRLGAGGIAAVGVALVVMIGSNLLVTNEYYALAIRNGGSMNWTDAIFRLSDYLKNDRRDEIYCVDWGILDSLRLLSSGKMPLRVGTDPINNAELNSDDREFVERMVSTPDHLFINHTKDFEFFPGVNDKLVKFARDAGYRREIQAVIPDGNGRPVYEVYRFVKTRDSILISRFRRSN